MILNVRDKDGNFIPIPAIRGEAGKSAYEQAKDGGYKGTLEEFITLLNGLTNTEDAAHYSDFNNPHKVTAHQIGALAKAYEVSYALDVEIQRGGNSVRIHNYSEDSLNTPYKEGKTNCTHGMVITNAYNANYGTQMCIPSGESSIYVRTLNGSGITEWVKVANATDLTNLGTYYMYRGEYNDFKNTVIQSFTNTDSRVTELEGKSIKIASGSYKGTNVYGTKNPNTLTFDFVPKFVIVSQRGERNATGGGCFIWINSGSTLNFINNGSNYWVHPTLTDKTLSWYCSESASYQLNSSSYTYDYFAWG